jgi:hypothetical protein
MTAMDTHHADHDLERDHGAAVDWRDTVRVALVVSVAAAVWFRVWEPGPVSVFLG